MQKSNKHFIIPDGIKVIGTSAFADCHNLISITIPNTVTNIDDNAFYGCINLKNIYFHGTVEEWKSIEISNTHNRQLSTSVIHCDDGIFE